ASGPASRARVDRDARVLGPRVAWVSAHQLLADARVMTDEKAGEVGRHLDGAAVRGEEVEHDGDAPRVRARLRAEEVLEVGLEPRGLALLVLDARRAAARERDALGGELLDPPMVADLDAERFEQVRVFELAEALL